MSVITKTQSNMEHVAFTTTMDGLQAIDLPHINLAIWQRSSDAAMQPIIQHLTVKSLELDYHVTVHDVAASLYGNTHVPTELKQSFLRFTSDIQRLAIMFSKHALTRSIRLMVESVDDVPCPKFHQDNITLRLICTYAGVGTQWLENDNVHTHAICCGGSIVRDVSRIQQLQPFESALMKGKLWSKDGMGIYHRSPKPEHDQPRLIVKMDVAP